MDRSSPHPSSSPVAGGALMPVRSRVRTAQPWKSGGLRYGRVEILSVSFTTDRAALAALCPPGFHPAEEALVSVSLLVCEDIDWLAGRGYNIVSVDIAARFEGEEERALPGLLCLVMWENMTEPILSGREWSGVAKIYGEIGPLERRADTARGGVQRFGHPIATLAADGLVEGRAEERAAAETARRETPYMHYKYIPRIEDDGADIGYASVYPSSGTCLELVKGEGRVAFHPSSFERNPTQHEIVNRLAALPQREPRGATLSRWAPIMLLDRAPRRLR